MSRRSVKRVLDFLFGEGDSSSSSRRGTTGDSDGAFFGEGDTKSRDRCRVSSELILARRDADLV